ncbi:hypothetical protein ABBQ38_015269 [Trebouxia sp. C0009 RCD-2024]
MAGTDEGEQFVTGPTPISFAMCKLSKIWRALQGSSPRFAASYVLCLLEDRLDRALHKLLTSSKGFEAISSHVHQSFKPKKILYTHVADAVSQLGDCPCPAAGDHGT